MDSVLFHTIWTVALLILFIGIWAWAWSSKRKSEFDAAARMPLDDGNDNRRAPATPGQKPAANQDKPVTTRRGEDDNG